MSTIVQNSNTLVSLLIVRKSVTLFFFFFNDTATTEIYTLSLHDALPIFQVHRSRLRGPRRRVHGARARGRGDQRSEEHTSELQSQSNLVCRLLLEKKKNTILVIIILTVICSSTTITLS